MSKVAIIYDSATHNTEIMANAIADGVKSEGIEVKISHVHEAKIKDIEGIDGLILGSGTYHHEIMPALESPEVVDLITNRLKGYGMGTVEGILIHEKPDEAGLEKCRQFGIKIAKKVKGE
jgi:flavorubredoxin